MKSLILIILLTFSTQLSALPSYYPPGYVIGESTVHGEVIASLSVVKLKNCKSPGFSLVEVNENKKIFFVCGFLEINSIYTFILLGPGI